MVCKEAGGDQKVLEELAGLGRSDEKGELWQNLRLDWVSNWDQSCQTTILLSRLQHTGPTLHPTQNQKKGPTPVPKVVFVWTELTSCDPAVLWRYLTALHDQHRVVHWIQNSENTELSPELVNSSTACSAYFRENILDLLARYTEHRKYQSRQNPSVPVT